MVGARKGPHRSLGFAFGYWFQTNGAPDASDITVRGNRTPTLRPSLAIGAACGFAAHSMRQTRSNSAISGLENGNMLAQLARNDRAQFRSAAG
jgi:hypothetical protein